MLASSSGFSTLVAGNEYYGAWRVQMTLPIDRTNLCSNPSFETNTTGWSAAGSPAPTIATTTDRAHAGSKSLLVTSTGAASFFPSTTFAATTTVGLDYIASVWVWVPEDTPSVGLFLSGVTFGETTAVKQSWTRVTMHWTATSTTSTIGIQCGFTASGQTFYVDDVLIVQASYLEDDVTLAVESVQINAQTVSDLPDGTRLQVGYPSIGCEFTLSGLIDPNDESKTAAWLFGRYSTSSPLYQQDVLYAPVTVDFGLYTDTAAGIPELIRKFTGIVDDYTANEDGSVTFTCIDTVPSSLRSLPTLSAVVTGPPYNAGLTSEFAVDYLLRRATDGAISSWPAQRSGCVLAVGMRSSIWPEVGTFTGSGTEAPTFADGLWGSGVSSLVGFAANATYTPSASITGSDVFIEFVGQGTVTVNGSNPSNAQIQVWVNSGTGDLHVVVDSDDYTQAGVITSDPQYVGVAVHAPDGSASWSASIRVGGTTYTTGARTSPHARSGAFVAVIVDTNAPHTLEALQVTTEASGAPWNDAFQPQAVLDPSLNPLDVVPEIAAGDPFQVIQQIADAELAVAGGDESGTFRFYNRSTIRGGSSQRAITSATSLTGVGGVETTAASVVNHATVESTGYNFATTRTTVWELSTARKVPKGGTLTLRATTDTLFANVDTTMTNLAGGSSDVANSHYRASVDKAGTAEFPGTLTFTVTQTGSTQLEIVISNPTGQNAWLVTPANYVDITVGTPLLRIAALAVTQGDTLTSEFQYPDPASGSRFGDQAYQLAGNPWIQDDDTAATLAQDIVQDSYLPKPNLTGVAIVPDPRIQLIDVVHIQDSDRTKVDEYARVFGWSINWSAAEDSITYDQTLDARTVALPGGWIGGVAGRSEGGQTTYGY